VALDLLRLNGPQREAVEHERGPMCVLAGAGTGKTRVITYRVARLLERGAEARRVLAVTFTNKAAAEMRERAGTLVGTAAARVWMGTFHSLGLELLREAQPRRPFTVYDQADQLGLVRELLRQANWQGRRFDPKAILFRLSRWKNGFVAPEQAAERVRDEYDEAAAELYPRYQEALRALAAYDFDDLLVEPVRMARPEWRGRFRHLLVDEYQDTNPVQLRLIEHLAQEADSLCVVGDDDQAIYGWRGAQADTILEFGRRFPGARLCKLEENYRSTPQVLALANAVIAASARKRVGKRLWTGAPGGAAVRKLVVADAEAEAHRVAAEIGALDVPPGEIAILYRSNVQARPFEDALREAGLPYRVVGGQEFYERKEVKDVLAYLRLALAPRDEIALRRIVNYPPRGIGPKTLERAAAIGPTLYDGVCQLAPEFGAIIERLRARLAGGDPAAAASALVDEIGLYDDLRAAAPSAKAADRRVGAVKDLVTGLAGRRELRQYLQLLTLRQSEPAARADASEAVTLCTLHGAKGLEFRVVFLVGLEEDLLPHARSLNPIASDVVDDAVDLDEERRLFYVGITRARERLYLSHARARTRRGRAEPVTPSRFLSDIPAELYDASEAADDGQIADDCMAALKRLIAP
jgi:DNA helicase-2/ATP-dependent DNA helicase PcrA